MDRLSFKGKIDYCLAPQTFKLLVELA